MKISELMLLEWQQESANTRKMEERVPTEKLSWRPHEKSMTIGRLATHIAELPIWFSRVIEAAEFDFASVAFKPYTAETTEELLDLFDKKFAASIALLETADDDTLNGSVDTAPRRTTDASAAKEAVLRTFALNHIYHHRDSYRLPADA